MNQSSTKGNLSNIDIGWTFWHLFWHLVWTLACSLLETFSISTTIWVDVYCWNLCSNWPYVPLGIVFDHFDFHWSWIANTINIINIIIIIIIIIIVIIVIIIIIMTTLILILVNILLLLIIIISTGPSVSLPPFLSTNPKPKTNHQQTSTISKGTKLTLISEVLSGNFGLQYGRPEFCISVHLVIRFNDFLGAQWTGVLEVLKRPTYSNSWVPQNVGTFKKCESHLESESAENWRTIETKCWAVGLFHPDLSHGIRLVASTWNSPNG